MRSELLFIYACILFMSINVMVNAQTVPFYRPNSLNARDTYSKSASFEENKGQITGNNASEVTYVYKSNGLSIFLLKGGIAYQFGKTTYPRGYELPGKFEKPETKKRRRQLERKIRTETYRMDVSLIGANLNATITTEGKSRDYINYYNANVLDVHSYSKVTYREIYPNIDWVIYKKGENIKYDFVVRPGGNPADIRFRARYVENLKLNEEGNLILSSRLGNISDNSPVSYQNNTTIATRYKIKGDSICFELDGFDPARTLIIDPTIEWATYYGGAANDNINKIATSGTNSVYAAGNAVSTNSIASGGYQNTYGGGALDAFLVKFNNLGVREWATYYGTAGSDQGEGCAVDNSGAVYLCGGTTSTASIAGGGWQNTYGGGQKDAFLVKFNSAGFREWATYYGGSGSERGTGCAVSNSGDVYLTGTTNSTNNIAAGGFQNTLVGGANAFLVKFNSNGVRIWGTYYGGAGGDGTEGQACAVNPAGDVFAVGITTAPNGIAFNGHQNTKIGYLNAFIVKFSSAGLRSWGSYYGNDEVYANACAVDGNNAVFLAGSTERSGYISSPGAHQTTLEGTADAYLVKFDNAGVRQWGTYYGGNAYDQGQGCDVDANGNVYLAGYTQSGNNISTSNQTNAGYLRAFLVKFNILGARQWGTYFGDSAVSVFGFACAVDSLNAIYLGGASGMGLLTTPGAHQPTVASVSDGFLAKLDGSCPTIAITSDPVSKVVCAGDTVMLTAVSSLPVQYQWKVNSGAGFVNVVNNLNYNGANNDTLFIYNVPHSWNGYTYECEFSVSSSCPVATTNAAQVTVNQILSPIFQLPTSICAGSSPFSLPPTSVNNISGVWNPSTINTASSGTYVFTPTPIAGQCLEGYVLDLSVNPSVSPAFNVNTNICVGSIAPSLPTTSLNNVAGTWSPGTISNTNSGTYTFSPSSGQCATPATLDVTVHNSSNSIDTKTICPNELPYTWNGIPNAVNGAVYGTTSIYGCDSTVTLNLNVSPPATTITFDTAACGSIFYNGNEYTHTTVVTTAIPNEFGCDSIVKIANLTVYPNTPIIEIIDTLGCDAVLFEGNTYTADSGFTNTYQNTLGCDSMVRKVNITVSHFELNLHVLPQDPYIGEKISLNSSANSNNYTVTSWSPNSLFRDQGSLSYSIIAEKDGIISISGRDSNGCTDTASVSYIVKPLDYGVFIPNAFTPNGDGRNDVFSPGFYMKRAFIIKTFKIFDRWGKLVYGAYNSHDANWDGNYNSRKAADLGTYSYQIVIEFLDGKTIPIKGDVILLR